MTYKCPNDPTHESDNADNCSICGARISPSPQAAEGAAEPVLVAAVGNSVLVDAGSEAVLIDPTTHPDQAAASDAQSRAQLELLAVVDPTLYVQTDPRTHCPVGDPDKRFPVERSQNLIGRRSERRGVFPEIALTDPGVSHRHAVIIREADGSLILQDVGSANGTQLNGKDVPVGVRIPLCAGDQIVLGCWTRITVQAVHD